MAVSDDGKAIVALTSEGDSPRFWLCTGYCADSLSKVNTLAPVQLWDLVCWPATGLYYVVLWQSNLIADPPFCLVLSETLRGPQQLVPAVCKLIS